MRNKIIATILVTAAFGIVSNTAKAIDLDQFENNVINSELKLPKDENVAEVIWTCHGLMPNNRGL